MRVSTLIHSSFLKVEREHSHFRATPEMTLKAAVSLTIFLYGNFIFIGFGGVLLFFLNLIWLCIAMRVGEGSH